MIADSVRTLAGQVLVAGFSAHELPPELSAAAGRNELAGFILFRRNLGSMAEVAALCEQLARAVPPGPSPLIAIDQEGGRVQRLGAPVLPLPPMRALGRIDDEALTRECARVLGAQLAALGFNLDFAPVLDVDSNPLNPVIGDRSFGDEPMRVVRHARAFAAGLAQAGVAACGKHFPGHGDTELDSHFALPRVKHDLARLEQVELAPFAQLARELPSIMTAHVIFDALDAERPATLSKAALQLLRERFGFGGVIVSDDLLMKAVADHHGIGESACGAIEAGCDLLLVCNEPELYLEAHAALCARAEHEAAFAARLTDAAQRCHALRCAHPLRPLAAEHVEPELARLRETIERRLADALAALP